MTFDKNRAIDMAGDMAQEFDAKKVGDKIEKLDFLDFFDDLKLLYQMVTDDRYTIDMSTKLVITGALVYVVTPLDLVPDFLVIVGYHDDAFVVAMVMDTLRDEIDRYRAFLKRNGRVVKKKPLGKFGKIRALLGC